MKEIKEIFKILDISDIKNTLEKIIIKIENSNREQQNKLLAEFVEEARKANQNFKNENCIEEGLYYYKENIAPIALLAEEITSDSYVEKDMLKVIKFNLNNYFKKFKESKNGDWYIDNNDFKQIIQTLELECNYFTILKKKGINLSIFYFNNRLKNKKIELINYDITKNSNFSIHLYHSQEHPVKENIEICLEQFGFLLKEILVGQSQRAPDGFIDLFSNIDMPEIDEESKAFSELFVNSFAHYIIEKMEIRITKELGKNWNEHPETRNEEFVKNMLDYFDNIFKRLLEDREEYSDNEKCPCGSGKNYKSCCKKKEIKYYKSQKENNVIKSIPIHPELDLRFREEKIKFKKLFGRTPGKNDFIAGGVLEKDLKRFYKLMKREGTIDRAWLYASDMTGLMLSEENMDFLSEREINEFLNTMKQYERMMKSKIKNNKMNELQAIETISFIIESLLRNKIDDMIYVLNLFINFYSQEKKANENFIIKNIKDFLVFCAYKTSINLKALKELLNGEYYDNAMGVNRIIFEILINIRTYKNDSKLFQEKIIPVAGIDIGTHKRISKFQIEEIATGKIYKYEIQKSQLAERAGENYKKLYDILYKELSEFIHLDTVAAKNIFKENDLFYDIDECLMAGLIGMILTLEIIMELIEFDGHDNKISKDIKYFSNILLKEFLNIIKAVIEIDDKEEYHLLENTLKDYKTNYKINYQRGYKNEVY